MCHNVGNNTKYESLRVHSSKYTNKEIVTNTFWTLGIMQCLSGYNTSCNQLSLPGLVTRLLHLYHVDNMVREHETIRVLG